MSGDAMRVPERAIGVLEGISVWLSPPLAEVRPRPVDLPCPACGRMEELLSARGEAAEFVVSPLQPPAVRDLASATAAEVEQHLAFTGDADVRMRFLVQAHLHWFGYFPELIANRPRPPARTTLDHNRHLGFPRSAVDGVWDARDRNAYRAFLDDLGPEGRTGWSREEDVLRAADAQLVRAKCAALYNRPDFDYYRQYRVSLTRSATREGVRPFLLRERNLRAALEPDPALAQALADEAGLEPIERLSCQGREVEAPFAPFEGLPADCTWPVRATRASEADEAERCETLSAEELPDELREKGLTPDEVDRLYPLYRFNGDRWTISYAARHERSYRNVGRVGRAFHGPRGSTRMHAGIDLYADYGDPVVAITDGQVLGFHNAAPLSTCFLLIYHPALDITVNYGEVHHESLMRMGLMVGDEVRAGQVIGAVGRMSSDVKDGGSMLHVDTYAGRQGTWFGVDPVTRLRNRLNPTRFLLAVRAQEAARSR